MKTKIKLIIVIALIILLLIYLYNNRIISKKILGIKYNNINNALVRDLISKEKFSSSQKEFCPQLDKDIFFRSFKPDMNSFFGMIPNDQPFNFYDSTKMIVETKNFIYALNESMTKISRANKIGGPFQDVSDKLIEDLNLDTKVYAIPFIAGCYETDECFIYLKIFDKENWNSNQPLNFKGEIRILNDRSDNPFSITQLRLDLSSESEIKDLNLYRKMYVESKTIDNKNYYNIYSIHREPIFKDNNKLENVYENILVNFHGNQSDNELFFYYGDKQDIKSYSRRIGNYNIDENLLDNFPFLNNENLDLYKLMRFYKNLENDIIGLNYLNIFKLEFEDDNYLKDYLVDKTESTVPAPSETIEEEELSDLEPKIFNIEIYKDFYEEVIKNPKYRGYYDSGDINNATFKERLDSTKRELCIRFAKECLKLLNKYKQLMVDEGFNIGVQDFNINKDRILIEMTNIDSRGSINFKHIKMNIDFIKEIIKRNENQEINLDINRNINGYENQIELRVNNLDIDLTFDKKNTNNNSLNQNSFIHRYNSKINDNRIFDNGNIFIKYDTEDNTIKLKLKEEKDEFKDIFNQDDFISKINIITSNLEYKYPYNFGYDMDYTKYFRIKKGSLTGKKNISGILEYKSSATLPTTPEDKKSFFHMRDVFFTLYAKPDVQIEEQKDLGDKTGALIVNTEFILDYEFNPSIKFEHEGLSLYNWFIEKQNEGKFNSRSDWFEIYDLMKLEGLYYPNPAIGYKVNNRNFKDTLKALNDSILEDRTIMKNNLYTSKHYKILSEIKEIYDESLDDFFPQLKIFKEVGMEPEKCFISVNFYPDNETEQNERINKQTRLLGLDVEPEALNNNNNNNMSGLRKVKFLDKYMNRDDRYEYVYHILIQKEMEIVSDEPNQSMFIWNKKQINNFTEYLSLITGNIQLNDNSRDRVRGLYEIQTKFMDQDYLNYLEEKKAANPHLKDIDSIIDLAQKNINSYQRETEPKYSGAHGYPFWIIYKTVDYKGNPCTEGAKNSQKLFLTSKILEKHIIDENTENKEYANLDQYPFIKEEFLSFTGYGNDIHFYGKKIGGSTQIAPKRFCDYPALPVEECKAESCYPKTLGLVRLDGSPKCTIQDDTVKTKSETPNSVEIIGNTTTNACDLYKLKGNKKLYYRLGRVFKFGRDGKYQLKNIYTIQQMFDGKYFFHSGDNIILKNTLNSNNINNYSFEGESKTDKYGSYYVFKPLGGSKYLTRKINVFDRQFENWTLDDLKDITKKQRNKEDPDSRIHKDDPDYYSQKFAIPDELIINMAVQDGKTSPEIDAKLNKLQKEEYLRCKTNPELCEGDKSYVASISPEEERDLLNKQLDDVRSMMNKLNQIPKSFFAPPNMSGLAKKIAQLRQTIPEMKTKIVEAIKANDYILRLNELDREDREQILLKKQTKNNISDNNNSMNNQNTDGNSFLGKAFNELKNTFVKNREQPKCFTLENFDNMYSNNSNPSLNKHISDEYTKYIGGKMNNTKDKVAEMQKIVGENLKKISELSNSMKMDGNTKQLLMSDKINKDNKLNQDIFKIKSSDQQNRITGILKKIEEIEKIRREMNEDDFRTKKQKNEDQYKTLISRDNGQKMNMYKINQNELNLGPSESNSHLLFLNGGCLSYDNSNIESKHCMIGDNKQMFKLHNIDNVEDMKKYNIKNTDRGMDRPYSIIMSNDNKCLHKENKDISFRNCDNVKNQYWDYSNISGPNM